MAKFENTLNVHDGAAVTKWISQINAGGTVYDIATHHSIKFVEGGEETTWNGLSDLTVVIPTIQDIVQSPIEFAGTVGANGNITWNEGHTKAETGSLVFITADCTFNGIACEAGDMAIYDGKKWNVVSGENQVEIVGTMVDNKATVTLSCVAKDVLTVEGKTLALALDYTDIDKHVKVTKGGGKKESVEFGDITVKGVGLKLEKAADVNTTIGANKEFQNATALTDGTVKFNVSNVVTSVDFGTFDGGAFPEAKRNTAKDFAVTGGSLTKSDDGSDFVTDVTLGEIKLVEAGAGDANKITVLSGITSGAGASFLNGIALTKKGETADLTIAGAYIPKKGVDTTFVEGLEKGTKVLTGYTAGTFKLTDGNDLVTGFAEGSDEVIGSVTATVNNDTDVLASASVVDHVLSFTPTKVASSVNVTTTPKKLELTKTSFTYTPTSFTESGFVTSGFEQADAINYTFGRANETVYTPTPAMWKISVDSPTINKGAYTINRNDMKVTVGDGVFVEDVTGGTLPTWSGYDKTEGTLTGSVGTALTTQEVSFIALNSDKINLPGAYSLKTVTTGADVTVGAYGADAVTIGESTVDVSAYLTSVSVDITTDEVTA